MSEESSQSPLIAQIAGILEVDDWNYQVESEGSLIGEVNGNTGSWGCRINVLGEPGELQVRVISTIPVRVPESRRPQMAEFLMRLNVDFTIGHFFLSFDEGAIGYYTNIELMDGILTMEMFRRIFYANLQTVDADLASILSVAYGQVTPQDAYQALSENAVLDAEPVSTESTLQ